MCIATDVLGQGTEEPVCAFLAFHICLVFRLVLDLTRYSLLVTHSFSLLNLLIAESSLLSKFSRPVWPGNQTKLLNQTRLQSEQRTVSNGGLKQNKM